MQRQSHNSLARLFSPRSLSALGNCRMDASVKTGPEFRLLCQWLRRFHVCHVIELHVISLSPSRPARVALLFNVVLPLLHCLHLLLPIYFVLGFLCPVPSNDESPCFPKLACATMAGYNMDRTQNSRVRRARRAVCHMPMLRNSTSNPAQPGARIARIAAVPMSSHTLLPILLAIPLTKPARGLRFPLRPLRAPSTN